MEKTNKCLQLDNFDIKENEGRQLFKSILDQLNITQSNPATDKYDTLDYYYRFKGKAIGVEIKTRNINYKNYSTHLMEVKKFKNLIKRIKSKELDEIYYVNFFGNNICYVYSLHNIVKGISRKEVVKEQKMMNKTTAVYGGVTLKDVILIPTKYALKLERIDNKWIKSR